MIIKENAIFIADAHFNTKRKDLKKLLEMLQNETLFVNQIFLMGDIFDFLASEIKYFININQELITLINTLSKTHETIYFEGNHDFNINDIFPLIHVIPRKEQPVLVKLDKRDVALAHGDIFTPSLYNIYTACIRNHTLLQCIDLFDIKNFISKYVEKKLQKKEICYEQNNFMGFIHERIAKYKENAPIDLIIEGHYHQGHISEQYINIPSLACGNKYMIYQNKQFSFNTL